MAKPNRLRELEAAHGNLHDVIPDLVNQKGQAGAAAALGVSGATISTWLKDNGYKQVIRYIRPNLELTEAGRAVCREMES